MSIKKIQYLSKVMTVVMQAFFIYNFPRKHFHLNIWRKLSYESITFFIDSLLVY